MCSLVAERSRNDIGLKCLRKPGVLQSAVIARVGGSSHLRCVVDLIGVAADQARYWLEHRVLPGHNAHARRMRPLVSWYIARHGGISPGGGDGASHIRQSHLQGEIRTRRAFSGHLLQTVTRRGLPWRSPGIVAVFPGAAGTAPEAWVPNAPLTSFRQLTAPS
jgi:hypothetical protein